MQKSKTKCHVALFIHVLLLISLHCVTIWPKSHRPCTDNTIHQSLDTRNNHYSKSTHFQLCARWPPPVHWLTSDTSQLTPSRPWGSWPWPRLQMSRCKTPGDHGNGNLVSFSMIKQGKTTVFFTITFTDWSTWKFEKVGHEMKSSGTLLSILYCIERCNSWCLMLITKSRQLPHMTFLCFWI